MPLPNANLPTDSLPWAREVEKKLSQLENLVNINNINNTARDATSQTNITNLLDLMADRLELQTYSTELDPSKTQTVTFTSPFSSFVSNTAPLDISMILNKPRKLLINYSTYYNAQVTIPATTTTSSYGFEVTIFVDGVQVDYQSTLKLQQVNIANNLVQDFDSINVTKLVAVPAGAHKVTVSVTYRGTPPTGGSLLLSTSADNLIVTVLQ